MRTSQDERPNSAHTGASTPTASLVSDALAAWETDGGARPGDARVPSGPATRITRITRLARIGSDADEDVGIGPLDPDAIEGIVAGGYQVLTTIRDQPPYTHVIGTPGGQDYLATLATLWTTSAKERSRTG